MQKIINTNIRQFSPFLIPYIVLLVIVLISKLFYSKEDIYFFINGLHFHAGDIFFPFITAFGNATSAFVVCLLLLFVSYRSSILMASSLLLTTLINMPLKDLFYAPRPSLYFADAPHSIYFVPNVQVLSNNFSFPSGHTVCAFTIATVLTYITPRKIFGYIYLLLALLVGYSRMYLSQHFLEDVTAGSALAIVVTLLWLSWFDNRPFFNDPRWNGALSRKKNAA